MKALVTGATGFVGSNLARRLLRDGHEVHLFVRAQTNQWRLDEIRHDLRIHTVSLDDVDIVEAAVASIKPDWIFHLAAHGAYSTQTELHRMMQVNIQGTVNLVEACLKTGFDTFVNTGSSSEYGWKDHAPPESEYLEPNSYYSFTKASATLFCQYAAKVHKVRIPTLRLYSVFGPYEEPSRLMPTLITHAMQGKLPPLVDPDIARDYIFTEDVNDAYMAAVNKHTKDLGAIYNVGSGTQTSLREVVEVVRRVFNLSMEPQWGSMPNRAWDTSVWVSDNAKIRSVLGWQPEHSFEDGFTKMVQWLKHSPMLDSHYLNCSPAAR